MPKIINKVRKSSNYGHGICEPNSTNCKKSITTIKSKPFKLDDHMILFYAIRYKTTRQKFLPKYFGPFIVDKK